MNITRVVPKIIDGKIVDKLDVVTLHNDDERLALDCQIKSNAKFYAEYQAELEAEEQAKEDRVVKLESQVVDLEITVEKLLTEIANLHDILDDSLIKNLEEEITND